MKNLLLLAVLLAAPFVTEEQAEADPMAVVVTWDTGPDWTLQVSPTVFLDTQGWEIDVMLWQGGNFWLVPTAYTYSDLGEVGVSIGFESDDLFLQNNKFFRPDLAWKAFVFLKKQDHKDITTQEDWEVSGVISTGPEIVTTNLPVHMEWEAKKK